MENYVEQCNNSSWYFMLGPSIQEVPKERKMPLVFDIPEEDPSRIDKGKKKPLPIFWDPAEVPEIQDVPEEDLPQASSIDACLN